MLDKILRAMNFNGSFYVSVNVRLASVLASLLSMGVVTTPVVINTVA